MFGSGGIYGFNVGNGSGAAGSGYSTIDVTGGLTVSSLPGSPFVIALISVTPGGGGPGAANFNPAISNSWTLVTATGGISGFGSPLFSVDTSAFQNALNGGSFVVDLNGNSLTLDFTASARALDLDPPPREASAWWP